MEKTDNQKFEAKRAALAADATGRARRFNYRRSSHRWQHLALSQDNDSTHVERSLSSQPGHDIHAVIFGEMHDATQTALNTSRIVFRNLTGSRRAKLHANRPFLLAL